MITKLQLTNFKNFTDATVDLGPFSVLVGTNASGKSNLRDAFRVLHGISRGYNLAEIIGDKWGDGGIQQWRGIRGGIREVATYGQTTFALKADVAGYTYEVHVKVDFSGQPPRVIRESLYHISRWTGPELMYSSHVSEDWVDQPDDPKLFCVRQPRGGDYRSHGPKLTLLSSQPALTQVLEKHNARRVTKDACTEVLDMLANMRFLDLSPDAMRMPSQPGQIVLGDRGENLSSVLQAICEDDEKKQAVVEWLQELTPLDVCDFTFVPDQTGRILLNLVEEGGQQVSAYSASDGTLRFLAMIAALLGPTPDRFYFFEELENGIHPTRLHLLVQLIEQACHSEEIQVVASTHSPQLLTFMSSKSREDAALIYRTEASSFAQIRNLLGVPAIREALEKEDLATLLASGWLENAVAYADGAAGGGG